MEKKRIHIHHFGHGGLWHYTTDEVNAVAEIIGRTITKEQGTKKPAIDWPYHIHDRIISELEGAGYEIVQDKES